MGKVFPLCRFSFFMCHGVLEPAQAAYGGPLVHLSSKLYICRRQIGSLKLVRVGIFIPQKKEWANVINQSSLPPQPIVKHL